MRTVDDFHVSDLTKLCDHHEQWFAGMAAQVMDNPVPKRTQPEQVADLNQYLTEARETCLEQCGRTE